jgi:hypothetical protein
MIYKNDANLDPAMWLLFEILRNACVPADNNDWESSTKLCLKKYKRQFRAAIRVLVWLELARHDRENALGFSPTDELMILIARKPGRWLRSKRTTQIREHRDALETIIESALKKDASDETLEQCAVNLLGALGLVGHHEKWARAVPTRRLTSIAAGLRVYERAIRYDRMRYKQDHRDSSSRALSSPKCNSAPIDGMAE